MTAAFNSLSLFFVLHSLLEVKVTEHERDADTRGGDGFGLWQSVRNVLKLEHWLLKITLRVRKQKRQDLTNTHPHKHTQSENGNDVCRVDMAVTLADCVDISAWLDVTFLWFGMSQPTKQSARAKIIPPRGWGGGYVAYLALPIKIYVLFFHPYTISYW